MRTSIPRRGHRTQHISVPSEWDNGTGIAILDARRVARNLSTAFAAQSISLLISIVTTLMVPKVLGVEGFGYWQLFIFYASFCGAAHLGLNDGVYLIHGGQTRDKIDRQSISSQFAFGAVFQLSFTTALLAASYWPGLQEQRRFILVALAGFLIVSNSAAFLGYLLQAMDETRTYSYSVVVERLAFLAPLIILFVVREPSFEWYVGAYVIGKIAALIYCLWKARGVLQRPLLPLRRIVAEARASISVGLKLMVANLASVLIIGTARFAIDATWGIRTFGELSLALALVTFYLVFITQASMVLFPSLRRVAPGELRSFYIQLRELLSLALPGLYLLYFPTAWILKAWLPNYAGSLSLLALLLPICVFDGRMNLLGTTYFKVLRLERQLLLINVAAFGFSLVGALVGTLVFHSAYLVLVCGVAAIALRALYAERVVGRVLQVRRDPGNVWNVLLTIAFILLTSLAPTLAAVVLYSAFYFLFLIVNRSSVPHVIGRVRRVLSGQKAS